MTTTVDHRGLQYVFAFRSKKSNQWRICSHRFRLHQHKQYVTGQYITSTWFSSYLVPGEDTHFMIIGIKGNVPHIDIEKMINKETRLGAPIGMLERKNNIEFKDYYQITEEDTVEIEIALKKDADHRKRFEMTGMNHGSQCILCIHFLEKEKKEEYEKKEYMYLSTPNFTR